MKKKTSISINHDCYFFRIKHGKKNAYFERLIKERLRYLKDRLPPLRDKFERREIVELINDMALPTGKWERKNKDISLREKQALVLLWEEVSNTGIEAEDLLEILAKTRM